MVGTTIPTTTKKMATIDQLIQEAHSTAKEKGFHDNPLEFGTLLMLVTSELGEALEADRKNKRFDPNTCDLEILAEREDEHFIETFKTIKDTVEGELADVFIRLFDLCGLMNIDIESMIKAKMRYNKTRPIRHGKAY